MAPKDRRSRLRMVTGFAEDTAAEDTAAEDTAAEDTAAEDTAAGWARSACTFMVESYAVRGGRTTAR